MAAVSDGRQPNASRRLVPSASRYAASLGGRRVAASSMERVTRPITSLSPTGACRCVPERRSCVFADGGRHALTSRAMMMTCVSASRRPDLRDGVSSLVQATTTHVTARRRSTSSPARLLEAQSACRRRYTLATMAVIDGQPGSGSTSGRHVRLACDERAVRPQAGSRRGDGAPPELQGSPSQRNRARDAVAATRGDQRGVIALPRSASRRPSGSRHRRYRRRASGWKPRRRISGGTSSRGVIPAQRRLLGARSRSSTRRRRWRCSICSVYAVDRLPDPAPRLPAASGDGPRSTAAAR